MSKSSKELTVESGIKLNKVERDQDTALETFIHRLVFMGVTTYEKAFDCLSHRQCVDMRNNYYRTKG